MKKYIRFYIGERLYLCIFCGFFFKIKSNLYKYRKLYVYVIKVGLVFFIELVVFKLDLEVGFIDVEVEIYLDGE